MNLTFKKTSSDLTASMDSPVFKTTQKFYSPAYYNKIGYKAIDVHNDLRLFCAPKEDDCKELRGLIYKKNKLVFASLPYNKRVEPYEVSFTGKFFPLSEGTIVNMFYINDRWFTASNKKFDLFKMKWASKTVSFGDTAFEAICHLWKEPIKSNETSRDYISRFAFHHLNPKYGYVFLLSCTAEEKLVCKEPKFPRLTLLALYYKGTHIFEQCVRLNNGAFIRSPKILNIENKDQLDAYLEGCDPYETPGVLYIDLEGRHKKIYTEGYSQLAEIRGNDPDVVRRFLYFFLRQDRFVLDCLICIHPRLKKLEKSVRSHVHRIALCYLDLLESRDWTPQYWMNVVVLNFLKENCKPKEKGNLRKITAFIQEAGVYQFIELTKSHSHLAYDKWC
ncbi:putative immediate-early protein [Lymphocystis disease virus 4]|uniref:Putative immediate-early protein n=1 Tax=Lymphocystis disease virus 4 TaxID=2704413 RepID=A0A6B9XJV4_9VIRU|nr:putative immediate-early protein [Lymphocystis disease virus 4]QHR78465.1 putative immediate-early protein [Lymphocystis disease virus 4]